MAQAPRVASLLPAATEIVARLGCAGMLVGVSHECDHPAEVRGRPILTRARTRSIGSSGAIDRDVRALVADALGVYEIDVEALERARPDVVVTQDLCDVCAVSRTAVDAALARVTRRDTRVVSLRPTRFADVLRDVERVAAALGVERAGADLARSLVERLDRLARRTSGIPRRPRVLTIEWLDPVMIGGLWMPELVRAAGGEPLVTRDGEHAPTLDHAALAALDPAPDVVVVKPCGFDLARTRAELAALREMLAPLDWPAVRSGRVWLADGNAYFNRPGPRLAESAEILAACLHPTDCADLASLHRDAFERVPREELERCTSSRS